jgi:hypothetical protein
MSGPAGNRDHQPRGIRAQADIPFRQIARSSERAQEFRAFSLTKTYIEAGHAGRVMLKAVMYRLSAAFVLALLDGSPLLAQHAPLSLCLVQTRPYASTQYDPPAGPWAIEMYDLLSARKLRSGAPLHITVLAAAIEEEVPLEVRRLQCPYVVQLRYHGDIWHGGRSLGANSDSVLFTLWNGATGKAIANGASLIPGDERHPSKAMFTAACANLTQQIMKSLNKLP